MIVTAIQKGKSVYVYSEKSRLLFTKNGELHGYTSNAVSVKNGNTIYTYNKRGALVSTHSAK